MGETAFLFELIMINKIIKINIIKLSIIISAGVFASLYFPSFTYAKEINSENIIELINVSRLENNLSPLVENLTLSKVAQSKVDDMAKNHYFAHTSPEGLTPWYWFDKNNYSYKYAGENLAINYKDVQEEHEAWMQSPAHKKNILNSNFSQIGIATSKGIIDGKRSLLTVTVFGAPEENIFGFSQKSSSLGKNAFITKAENAHNIPLAASSYQLTNKNSKIIQSIKKQSNNIIWTVTLIALLIVLKDIILKTINTNTFHHKHSLVNLILFIMLYTILF